jgi:serine/threonine protein kinase
VAREIRIHKDLHHEGIITMYAAWSDSRFVYIAMEWAPEVGAGSTPPLRTQLHD